MLQQNIQMNNFINQIKYLATNMIIKKNKLAISYEVGIDGIKKADKYITTIENGVWDSYVTFDEDILRMAGIKESLISYCIDDKNNIPRELRSTVVKLQNKKIISEYEEENDYYRTLNGKPKLDETSADWIYVPENEYGIPTNIPVHELGIEYIGFLESSGILDSLIEKYPKKEYLHFLGEKAIPYYKARVAQNYEILYMDTNKIDENIYRDFRICYDKARSYYMIGLYNQNFSNTFLWYDEFMGFCILIMAIQRLISNIYKQGLNRDFYDVELIKFLFNSYSIPYIEGMDIRYHKKIAKSLNILLQYKSTDKVLYDITKLMGFYNSNIYRYYLIKTHKLDADGNPIFSYEKRENEDGTITKIPIYKNMFNFHFQQVNLKEKDINTALTDTRKSVSYYTIISEDPYWISDYELEQKMYETNFNNLITKYMSLDVAFKIVEMMYEVSHTLRMFIDNQKDFKLITISVPKISSHEISLFDVTIFLCCLGAKKLGLKGKIPIKGYQIPSVYGFNYKADLNKIINDIYENEGDYTKIDPGLVKYILNMRASEAKDVDRLFKNITAFRKMVTMYLFKTKDKETYYQYKKLYKALLLTEDVQELYKSRDGDIQETYLDLLREDNPELYEVYDYIIENGLNIDEYINDIYIKISKLSSEYKYMASINQNDAIFEFILKLIRFFKSYTVDFVNSGIHYFLDDRYLMGLKLIDDVWLNPHSLLIDPISKDGNTYKDYFDNINIGYDFNDEIKLNDYAEIFASIKNNDYIIFEDKLKLDNEIELREDNLLFDALVDISKTNFIKDNSIIKDNLYMQMINLKINANDNFILKENVKKQRNEIELREDNLLFDALIDIESERHFKNKLSLKDDLFKQIIRLGFNFEEYQLLLDKVDYNSKIDYKNNLTLIDKFKRIENSVLKENIKIKDSYFINDFYKVFETQPLVREEWKENKKINEYEYPTFFDDFSIYKDIKLEKDGFKLKEHVRIEVNEI